MTPRAWRVTPFNQPITSVVVPLQSHPCYWQVQRESFIADGRKVMALASHFMLMPQGSDIAENDRVTAVTDRKGRAFKSNTLRVMAVVRREDHLEIAMEEYS